MAFADELAQMLDDVKGTFGIAGTLIIQKKGAIDTATGVRAGTPLTQDIVFSVTPTVREGKAEVARVWCKAEDVTLADGVPEIGWQFAVFDRTWTVTSVERDANESGYWLTGSASAR